MMERNNRKQRLADILNAALTAANAASGNYAGAALHGSKLIKALLSVIGTVFLLIFVFLIIIISIFVIPLGGGGSDSTPIAGGSYLWPIQGMTTYISSPFGDRINPVTHKASHHDGIDIAGGNINMRPISAAADGTVEKLVTHDVWYGNYVLLDHANNIKTFYGHCSGFALFKVGDTVKTGDTIAYVGSTGNSTGPHLHFGVLVNNKYVDPTQFEYGGMKCSNYSEYHKK